jgi:isocitrate lyase
VVRDRRAGPRLRPRVRPGRACSFPGKLLSYNCSPSFNWKKNLDDKTIAKFQDELSALGYKYQFITLAGIHINWFNTFQFAHAYARGEGMKHYVDMVQEQGIRRSRA